MTVSLRHGFIASALAGSLLGVPQIMTYGQQPAPSTSSASSVPDRKIALVKLSNPLPFTPQEFAEPFSWKVRLIEKKEDRQTIMHSIAGTHLFTFHHDESGKVHSIFSPLNKDDPDLCDALTHLRTVRPDIYTFLNANFNAAKNCGLREPKP